MLRKISSLIGISLFTVSLWIVLWLGNAYVSDWMDNIFSWHKEPVKRLMAGLAAMVVFTVGAVFLLNQIFYFAVGFDVSDRLYATFYSTLIITLIISMFMTGRSFTKLARKRSRGRTVEKESIEAQYNSLRNQVNPHFLFNSLNALTNLVYQNQDEAARFIKQLAAVYRYVLSTRDKELVTITEEIEFLQSYLFLQQIRFGNKLKWKIDLKTRG
ncbi:MAG: histidine kinase [Cyclobacteriaceae bacterium]|nr:MAG: histidine kinase [Cyclobacteriaceae bacterium]